MTTYRAMTDDGRVEHFAAYTESDAFQKATDWADGQLLSFESV